MLHVVENAPVMVAPASGEKVLEALVNVMVDLMELLKAENELLSRGTPAALTNMTERKNELSDEFAALHLIAQHSRATEIVTNKDLLKRLTEIGREMDKVASENMERLQAAMAATRGRIEAVMAAVLKHEREITTYSPHGRHVIGHPAAYRVNWRS